MPLGQVKAGGSMSAVRSACSPSSAGSQALLSPLEEMPRARPCDLACGSSPPRTQGGAGQSRKETAEEAAARLKREGREAREAVK